MGRVKSKGKRARAARKLFAGGAQAVAAYGCEVAALTEQQMTALARAQLQAMGHYKPGMDMDMAYAVLGMVNPRHQLVIAPALRYAREWWLAMHPTQHPTDDDVLTRAELTEAIENEVNHFKAGGTYPM